MSGQSLVTVYTIHPEVKLIAGVISLRSFWQKWNFISGDKISCKHYPKWNHMKGNICTCVNKNDWILLNGPFISDHPRNKNHFISPAMRSNVNRIYFMVTWSFVSERLHLFVSCKQPLSFFSTPMGSQDINWTCIRHSEDVLDRSSHPRCSVKKVFLEISQNSQENICARVSF